MIKHSAALLLAAAMISTAVHSSPKFGIDELISSLGQPSTWRALGNVKPGIENGVAHDIYRNSAVIAEVVHSAGVDVPFVKLTDDPSAATKAFVNYIIRAEQDKNFSATDESCGIGVSYLYGMIFSQLLQIKGPQWVTPGITGEEAQAISKTTRDGALVPQETLAKLCNGWKYRKLNATFAGVLKRVGGEMPYLLGGPLRINQLADDKRNEAAGAVAEQTKEISESRRRGTEMVDALKGVSPPVIADPFAHCIGIANDSVLAVLKDQCIDHIMESAMQDHNRLLRASMQGISTGRINALKGQDEALGIADYTECKKPEQERLANDDGSGPRKNEAAPEIFSRCHYVRLKHRDSALRASPPLTDVQLATNLLNHANDIGRNYRQLDAMPPDTKREYLAALDESSTLGNMRAKTLMAQIKSQNLEDIKSLVEAEHLLNQIDKAQASTADSIAIRENISFPLHAWRLANSPEQKRIDLRTTIGEGSDDAGRAAIAMDDMSRKGGMCDTLVVQAYNYAMNNNLPENVRIKVILGDLLESASRMSCIR
ncbi:hypothetical protein [Pseudomonas sp. HY13-MNA-CIBAN-0226]|uniref:hypothetical protein n=1 Tax=Pseudomonas sp. HY13-MNA-CIBAN-0226 TaxID=3140473 RepID=UPI003325B64E